MRHKAGALFIRQGTVFIHLILWVVLSLALMIADGRLGYSQRLRRLGLLAVSPLQYVVDLPSKTYTWLSHSVSSQKALVDENTKLKYHQALLESKLQRMSELKTENQKLRQLLHYHELKKEYRLIVSELLAVKTSPYRQLLILDKGINQGVTEGLAVFDSDGVMGQIIEVGPFTSTLLLVTDTKSAIPVKNARTGDRGIVVGQHEHMTLLHVPKTTSVEEGDTLLTSGLGQRFPEGYPVGKVVSVKRLENEAFQKVIVRPLALIDRSRLLLVVKPDELHKKLSQELSERYHVEKVA